MRTHRAGEIKSASENEDSDLEFAAHPSETSAQGNSEDYNLFRERVLTTRVLWAPTSLAAGGGAEVIRLLLLAAVIVGAVYYQASRNGCVWRGLDHVEEWLACVSRI